MTKEKAEERRALGRRLFELRTAHHLTQEQLAEKLDIDSRALSRYENGEREMGALLYGKMLALFPPVTASVPDEWEQLSTENRKKAEEFIRILYKAQCYENC